MSDKEQTRQGKQRQRRTAASRQIASVSVYQPFTATAALDEQVMKKFPQSALRFALLQPETAKSEFYCFVLMCLILIISFFFSLSPLFPLVQN